MYYTGQRQAFPAEHLLPQASARAKGDGDKRLPGQGRSAAIKKKDKEEPSFLSPTHCVSSDKWAERSQMSC